MRRAEARFNASIITRSSMKIFVDGRTSGLKDKHIHPSHTVFDLNADLAIAETPDQQPSRSHPAIVHTFRASCGLELPENITSLSFMVRSILPLSWPKLEVRAILCGNKKLAGVGGFEPPSAGSKDPCLTAWRHPKHEMLILFRQLPSQEPL